ncbi:hypothetical protein L1987_80808 [Smallanthus sonchifolius]|uniref:Uncharacterized protein n=1 Tax=Smallanthus sonchifolius TaxID=185202 RepID=A0ACB8YPB6_9ASTR|nr:hypothetical protein L1987_80808 [Smallanthus sonchifolius]
MAVTSPSLQGNFYAASSKFSFLRSDWCKRRTFRCKKRGHSAWIIRSVMNNKESSINGDEIIEPTRILLERLFTQTQKLEEKIGKDLNLPQDIQLELNLGTLESDLQAALTVLRKRVEDLEDAENKLLSEYSKLTQAKEELGKQEEVIKHTFLRQEKLENELKQANLELAFQAAEIENLKLQLEKQDKEITAAQSALVLKQNEIDIMTKEILNKQTLEIEELRKTVEEKDEELQIATTLLEIEEENLKVVEGNLEKQTMDWLLAQEEMRNLADEASKHTVEGDENLQEFTRVKKLLADVRLELVSSQKSLASSRKEMEDQQEVLEKELLELEQHRESLIAYAKSLGDAEVEVESERVKLRLAEARNQELKRDLLIEKDVIKELQNQLDDEKHSLLQATEEMSVLRDELDRKKSEYESMRIALESKESQLVEAKLEIQHLKSTQAFLELMLKEKESELSQAQEMLSEVNQEILNLKMLLSSRETELTETTTMLKERDKQVEKIQHDRDETNLKYFEARSVVERIFELTNKVVSSIEHEGQILSKEKQLETELDLMMETLRSREMEVLQTRRALTIKENELKMALNKLNERENEMKEMRQELTTGADESRKLYEMVQERIGELAIEKLELEAAQLEVEAATNALEKITEMSRELLRATSVLVEVDYDIDISTKNIPETASENGCLAVKNIPETVSENGCLAELKTEVARLSDWTETLVREAGIDGDVQF